MTAVSIRTYPRIPSNVEETCYPLTFQQERVIYFCELDPDSSIWDINTCKRLTGKLDINKLGKAVERLVGGHQILKTRIFKTDGDPKQSFDQDTSEAFRHIDMTNEAAQNVENALSLRITEICQKPISKWTFDDLLFEVVAFTLTPVNHVLLFRIHHIISDAASVDVLWRDLADIYNQLVSGAKGELPPKTLKYSDYAIWQRRQFDVEQTREQEEYWLAQFSDEVPALDLPTDFSSSAELSFKGGLEIVEMPKELIEKLQVLSWKKRVLLFSSLFSAYFVLLQKFCQQEDITVGALFSGRHYSPDLQEVVGFFVNMAAVRVNVGWDCTFDQLVEQVHEKVEMAYSMQDYPFERLVQKLAPNRDDGRMPLVRTMFNVVSNADDECMFAGMEKESWVDVATQTNAVQVDLIFDIHWGAKGAEIRIEHNTDIFKTSTVSRLAEHYITLLEQLGSGWDVGLSELELVTDEEKQQLIEGVNPESVPYAHDKCVHELFEEQANKRPEDIAIVDGDCIYTYEEANKKTNRLARVLRGMGVVPDSIVAIIGERTADMVLGQLGILKAGGAYLPIVANSPKKRIHEMLRDAAPRVLILPDSFDDDIEFDGPVLRLGDAVVNEADEANLANLTGPSNLAYVLYTSGSTGVPKGVMVEQRSVVNLAINAEYVEFRSDDRILQTGAPAFDATTFEVWGALLNGLRLYVVGEEVLLDAEALGKYLEENQISIMFMTPPLFHQSVEVNNSLFKSLRYLIVGGDVLSVKHVELARKANPSLTIINGYGPTENTTFSTCYTVVEAEKRTIPIGTPIPNSRAYILDREMKPSPIGAIGELYVGGDGLARGYLNRPELTREKFIPDPFLPGERVYKTGDLTRRRPDGNIEFIGRADNQVKIRGFRIELGEIENRLLDHENIKEAIATSSTGEDGNKFICAYYVAGSTLTKTELRKHLADLLPGYMVPSYFCQVEQMPLTESGKIDQKMLPVPQMNTGQEKIQTDWESATETSIARIWEELLGTSNIGAHDNFFDVGGHSMTASWLARRLSMEFGVKVSLRTIFDSPTVAELATLVGNDEGKSAEKRVV
ncbi:MAG: amino acid adenylation domain-containing protein [Rhodospirillales bacterium]|nr:amino acid adenylation domain-containing protein [Rhodospirillales bacterium]